MFCQVYNSFSLFGLGLGKSHQMRTFWCLNLFTLWKMKLLILGSVKISSNEVAFQYGLDIQYGLNANGSEIYR